MKTAPQLAPFAAKPLWTAIVTLFVVLMATAAQAELTLSNLFGDGMVLQRDKPVKVWGFGAPHELVKVTFAGQSVGAEGDEHGKWVATLPPMPASSEPRELVIEAKSGGITIQDVLVGEVWICGGQSNMEWTLRGSLNWDLESQSANTPEIRYLQLPNIASHEVARDIPENDGWRSCTPEQVERCTAVGYYFARRLHRYLKVPVGIVDNSWGGTAAQHWCSRETLEEIPEMQPYLESFDKAGREWVEAGGAQAAQRRYEADLAKWETQRKLAESEKGLVIGRRPNMRNYADPRAKPGPATLYNTLLKPMSGLAVRGVVWYQGENNAFGEAWKPFYRTYPSVVADWRAALGNPDLPFGLVQIAGWSNRRTMEYDQNHHTNVIRELQFETWQQTPHTGLIVTYDANTDGNIHPKNKRTVGERAARWALAEVYGVTDPGSNRPLKWRGPVYQSYKVEDDKIVVQFDPATAAGLRLDLDTPQGFYIAGEDRQFHVATASVDASNSTVTIWADAVQSPVAARYAVSNLPNGTLLNALEIPAYPFRTDAWPITPHQSQGSFYTDRENPVVEQ